MAKIIFPLAILHHRVNRQILSEAVLFPEISRVGSKTETTSEVLKGVLETFTSELHTFDLHSRRAITAPRLETIDLEIEAPQSSSQWTEPVKLEIPIVVWTFDDDHILVHVPSLKIDVIVHPKDDFNDLVKKEILSTIRREEINKSLHKLCLNFRVAKTSLETVSAEWEIPTLKQRAKKLDESFKVEKPSILKEVATPLNGTSLGATFRVETFVQQMAEYLTAESPQSVLLIGPSGAGKTAIARELVRTAAQHRLGQTPFYQTSGARLIAGQTGFGMWQERAKELIREVAKKRAILLLGNVVELMEVGKSEFQQTGLAGFLRPEIARGQLLCIMECTPEQIPLIEKEDPLLLDAFQKIEIPEPDDNTGLAILRDVAEKHPRWFTSHSVLDIINRLHRRYATYSAFPGRPIRFLNQLLLGERTTSPTAEEVRHSFSRETGLPRVLLDPDIPLDLAETTTWFQQRVIGQPEAILLVVSLLATVKAGLSRPGRPVASLLFVGPSGVGKTETAKALAEFLFGSAERLTRFDMSEYADPMSARRLVGTAFGTEGLLTAKIREQPFSVLLLDEFEKADPSVFDLLLQILGEARLTDAGGRLADFRNAVIILTSNLGAEAFRAGRPGITSQSREAGDAREHFTRAAQQFLRPEMFNRIDRLVPFLPLDAATIERIALREWDKVLAREGIRDRGTTVALDQKVRETLCELGFDPRYGARPLKRAIERQLLAPLAKRINDYSSQVALEVKIEQPTSQILVNVRPQMDTSGREIPSRKARVAHSQIEKYILRTTALRRQCAKLETSTAIRDLSNELYQLSDLENRITNPKPKSKKVSPPPLSNADQIRLAKLGRLRQLSTAYETLRETCIALEEGTLLAYHSGDNPLPADWDAQIAEAENSWGEMLLRLYEWREKKSSAVTLGIFSEDHDWLEELARAYLEVADRQGMTVSGYRYLVLSLSEEKTWPGGEIRPDRLHWLPGGSSQPNTDYLTYADDSQVYMLLAREFVPDLSQRLYYKGVFGVGLGFASKTAYLRFGWESGIHRIVDKDRSDREPSADALILPSPGGPEHFIPPAELTRRGDYIKNFPVMRTYNRDRSHISDGSEEDHSWNGDLPDGIEILTQLVQNHNLNQVALT